MSDPDLERLERIFQAAADLPTEERADYLDRECGDEPELRGRIEAMLADLLAEDSLPVPALGPAVDLSEGLGQFHQR